MSFVQGANLLKVDRDSLRSNFSEFRHFNNRMELKVLFDSENADSGADAGGMSKEWFSLISQMLIDPKEGKPSLSQTRDFDEDGDRRTLVLH